MFENSTSERMVKQYEIGDCIAELWDVWYGDYHYLVGIMSHKFKDHTESNQFLWLKREDDFERVEARLKRVLDMNAKSLNERYSHVGTGSREPTKLDIRESSVSD